MTPSSCTRARRPGFTLLEVMAAVLVLGLLYTVLVEAAMRGLRSEGIDRRRAEASLLADRQLAEVEATLAAGIALPEGVVETEAPPYAVRVEVVPEDVLGLLPPEAAEQFAGERDPQAPSLLVDPRGGSRVQRVSVVVSWDEAGEVLQVTRTTHALDTTELAALFPAAGEPSPDEDERDEDGESLESALGGGRDGRGRDFGSRSDGGRSGPRDRPGDARSPGDPPGGSGRPSCSSLPSPIREFAEANGACDPP